MNLMENEILTSDIKGHRTLATVVFTDCVGFSARMSVNEEHTLDLIRRDLNLMKKICEDLDGRVLKSTGDGLLMCFSSAVKAVDCAIKIQRAISQASAQLQPSDVLLHRVGIHLADMYITETDVMGNGVNIAARLQTEAEPGGICISQTVYDVAKHGLQLVAEYLGPRELKNIREVIPVYKVIPEPENTANDAYTKAALVLEQSQQISRIRKLLFYACKRRWETDDSKLATIMMKGLIQEFLGLASSYEELRGILNAAVSNLSKQIEYSLVANEILKVVEIFYAPKVAAQHFTVPGILLSEHTGLLSNPPEQAPSPDLGQRYEQIAQTLEQHSDLLRIKKLLYYICRRRWESNVQRLGEISTITLIQEIHGIAPEPQQLRSTIDKFVQTLNKQVEYALVGQTLIQYLSVLYDRGSGEATASPQPPLDATASTLITATSNSATPATSPEKVKQYQAIAAQLEQSPHITRIKKLMVCICTSEWLNDSAQLATLNTATLLQDLHRAFPAPQSLHHALKRVVSSLSKQAEYLAIANFLMQSVRPLYQNQAIRHSPQATQSQVTQSQAQTAPPQAKTVRSQTVQLQAQVPKEPQPTPAQGKALPIDPPPTNNKDAQPSQPSTPDQPTKSPQTSHQLLSFFDVRLGILKYTNPLRAKILAFSALHSDFNFTDQDWFNLKTCDLEELLKGLLQTCKNYTDLELLLFTTARRLRDADELVQAADTITKCLRAFYIYGSPALAFANPSVEATKIGLDVFEESTRGLTSFSKEYEYTSQLAPMTSIVDEVKNQVIDPDEHTALLPSTEQGS